MTVTHARLAQVILVALLAGAPLACSTDTDTDSDDDDTGVVIDADQLAAAERLCPLLWEWTTSVGGAFNDTSRDVADLDGPDERRAAWDAMLDRIETLDRELLADIDELEPTSVLDPLVNDVRVGIDRSLAEIDDLRQLMVETPDLDDGQHQARAQQLIVRVEKVIDVVKPSLSDHDVDGSLAAAFREVASCQHAVKDANDGLPRFNG